MKRHLNCSATWGCFADRYGQVYVTHLATIPHKHFLVRAFEIEFNGEKRELKQFAYTSWPDHGVPLTTQELLGFRNAVRSSVTKPAVPILIHCSAGVGRTGTYIAIDRLVTQALDMGDELSIDKIVHDMRMQRNFMVQTEVQYMFVYRAVLDALSELLSSESEKVRLWSSPGFAPARPGYAARLCACAPGPASGGGRRASARAITPALVRCVCRHLPWRWPAPRKRRPARSSKPPRRPPPWRKPSARSASRRRKKRTMKRRPCSKRRKWTRAARSESG